MEKNWGREGKETRREREAKEEGRKRDIQVNSVSMGGHEIAPSAFCTVAVRLALSPFHKKMAQGQVVGHTSLLTHTHTLRHRDGHFTSLIACG